MDGAALQGNREDFNMLGRTAVAAAVGLGLAWSTGAYAQETVKIGLIMAYSGPFADTAKQMQAGIDLWLAEHNGEVAGKKVEAKGDVPSVSRVDGAGPVGGTVVVGCGE